MNDNARSNERSNLDNRASIDSKNRSKSISAAHNTIMTNDDIDDFIVPQTTFRIMYVCFVECQI